MIPGIVAGQVLPAVAGGGGPVWLSTTNTASAGGSGTSLAVAMPATVVAGDLLIMAVVVGDAWSWSGPSGWTALRSLSLNGIGSNVFYKVAAGTEGGTTVSVSVGETVWMAAQVIRMQAGTFNTTTPLAIATAATGSSSQPNSGSLSPSWGSASSLWISVAAGNMISEVSVSAWPYASAQNISKRAGAATGSLVPFIASCCSVVTSATQDPAAWSMSSSINKWIADTIAIRPA